MIEYQEGQDLELWIRDTGTLDGFAAYVNDSLFLEVDDSKAHKIPLKRPSASAAIVIEFYGGDGGISAIVEKTAEGPRTLKRLEGKSHGYLLSPV